MLYIRLYVSKGKTRCIKLYKVWCNMQNRCTNPDHEQYKNYGGRGIRVCDEWDQFDPFRAWALSCGYGIGLTIDRRDNDGDYCPTNCRWVSREENAKNRGRKETARRQPKPRRGRPTGIRNAKARFSAELVRKLRASDKSGRWWARKLNCAHSIIQNIRSGQTYRDVL